jgi:hypothetical protein
MRRARDLGLQAVGRAWGAWGRGALRALAVRTVQRPKRMQRMQLTRTGTSPQPQSLIRQVMDSVSCPAPLNSASVSCRPGPRRGRRRTAALA